MECPFELPVEAIEYKDTYTRAPLKHKGIKANDGTTLVKLIWPSYADYIVQAINSHEELVNACEKAKWLYDELALSTLGAACKYGDDYEPPTKEDCLSIRELLEQALKESETA